MSNPHDVIPHIGTFNTAGQLLFGTNAIDHPGEVAEQLDGRRVFSAADNLLVRGGSVIQERLAQNNQADEVA